MEYIRVTNLKKHSLENLLELSIGEGYRFINRLVVEYDNGVNKFDKQGELLLLIQSDGETVGIGGINIDPYIKDNSIGRLRHIYIAPQHRGNKLGERLVIQLLKEAKPFFTKIRLQTDNPIAEKLYEKLGFKNAEGLHKASHQYLYDK